MAVKNCTDCGGKVSTKAGACPHCGRPMTAKNQTEVKKGNQKSSGRQDLGNAIGLLAVMLAIVAGMGSGSWSTGIAIAIVGIIAGIWVSYF